MIKKIIYWTSTGIIAAMMLFSAFGYLTSEEMKGAFVHLGFPNYFRVELAIAKILGAIALLIPLIPARIKEFAYFGFGLTFVSLSANRRAQPEEKTTNIWSGCYNF